MNVTNTLEQFRAKFRVEELLILDSGSWSWSVRPGQPTLGAGVLSLNRYARHLADVSPPEMAELADLIKALEQSIKAVFDYNIMNYLMLMMVDHHVHYHVIPRYDGARTFAGLEWVDNGWPALPVLGDNQHQGNQGVLSSIRDALVAAASQREAPGG
jgi:diadenosine tetraphosphate (Ap4A) HIT family hydrolase